MEKDLSRWFRLEAFLVKTRLLAGNVAPTLDHRLLHLLRVPSWPRANFFRDIHAFLFRSQFWNQFGDVVASSLRFNMTLFCRFVLYNCLNLVIAYFCALFESASGRGAQLSRYFLAVCYRRIFLDILFCYTALLSGPHMALCLRCVSNIDIFTLLFFECLAVDNVILNLMLVLMGVTFRFVLGSANRFSCDWTIFHQRIPANLDCLVECNLVVINETVFPVVFFALLFLLCLKGRCVRSVTLSVIRMVARDLVVVNGLFNHHHLVYATFSLFVGCDKR